MMKYHNLKTFHRLVSFRQPRPLWGLRTCFPRWSTTEGNPPTPSPDIPSQQSSGKKRRNRGKKYLRTDLSHLEDTAKSAPLHSLNSSQVSPVQHTTAHAVSKKAIAPTSATPDVSSLVETFSRLCAERDALDALESYPLVEVCSMSNPPKSSGNLQRHKSLFEETVSWLDHVEELGSRPADAQSSKLAILLGQAVSIFNKIPPAAVMDDGKSVFKQCQRVLGLLRKYNLTILAFHYDCAIRVALREQNWLEASELFWEQIDPDAGNPPVDVSVVDPIGLYAIARLTQQRGGAVAEQVMDAVNQMTMISPMNQDKYILAAGTTLGHAGAFKSMLNFLRTSLYSQQLGEPLVSATMHACIICNQHEQALKAFNERYGVSGSTTAPAEWQIGGGVFRLSPLCRDLAMRASLDTQDQTTCARAIRYFQEAQKENVTLSLEALLGVCRACETTENWEDSVGVFFAVLDRSVDPGWIVSGNELSIAPISANHEAVDENTSPWWFPGLIPVLACTMRSCNAAGHFATALLCARLFELALVPRQSLPQDGDTPVTDDLGEDLDHTLFRVITKMQHDDELLSTIMTSLCGLSCFNRAVALFVRSRNARGLDASNETLVRFTRKYDPRSAECFLYALSKSTTAAEPSGLDQLWGRIHRYSAAIRALELAGGTVPANQELVLANELADLMRSCTSAGFPDASICLARRTERMKLSGQTHTALAGMMMSFLGVADASFGDFLLSHDSTLAEYVRSYSLFGWHDAAIDLFKSKVNQERDSLAAWTLSCNAAIEALSAMNRTSDAISVFQRLGAASNSETFIILSKALTCNAKWQQVCDMYAYASQNGHFSKELAFLTMQAITKTSDQDSDELRRIVADAASYEGLPDHQWVRANYWLLIKRLGLDISRRLMGWDDVDSRVVGEIDLALEAFNDRSLNPVNEDDILWAIVLNSKDLVNRRATPTGLLGVERLPRDKQEWTDLMVRVLNAAKGTGLLSDGRFLTEMILVLRALGGSREIEDLVNYAMSSGWKLDRETLTAVRHATTGLAEGSILVSDLEFLRFSAA